MAWVQDVAINSLWYNNSTGEDPTEDTPPANVTTGAVGLIYGMDVFFSQAIGTSGTVRSGAVYVPEACAFAASQDVRLQSQYDVDYLGTKVIADMIYGAKLLDSATNKMGLNFVNAS